MRVLAIRSAIGSAALLVLLAIALYWLLQTVAGSRRTAEPDHRAPAGRLFLHLEESGRSAGRAADPAWRGFPLRENPFHRRTRLPGSGPASAAGQAPAPGCAAAHQRHAGYSRRATNRSSCRPGPNCCRRSRCRSTIQADTLAIDGLRITQSTQPLIDIRRANGGIDIGDGYFKADPTGDRQRSRAHRRQWRLRATQSLSHRLGGDGGIPRGAGPLPGAAGTGRARRPDEDGHRRWPATRRRRYACCWACVAKRIRPGCSVARPRRWTWRCWGFPKPACRWRST